MKLAVLVALVATTGLWVRPGIAEMTPDLLQKAEAFKADVHALDPRAGESELAFQSLVGKYVPAEGPVQSFLDFMTASGFQCPAATSLAEDAARKVPTFTCRFQAELGAAAEPNLSSVTEDAWFGVVADSDAERRVVVAVQGYMSHGFTGP